MSCGDFQAKEGGDATKIDDQYVNSSLINPFSGKPMSRWGWSLASGIVASIISAILIIIIYALFLTNPRSTFIGGFLIFLVVFIIDPLYRSAWYEHFRGFTPQADGPWREWINTPVLKP
jgi:hypothetical protein